MPFRTSLLALFTLSALGACAESRQAWRDFSASTKRTMRSIGKSCPAELPGRASGAADPDGALGCFQKAVAEEDPQLLLRTVCHGRTTASCKHPASAEKEAKAGVHDFSKHAWNDLLGEWSEGKDAKVHVFAIDNLDDSPNVSTVTVCRIADVPGQDGGVAEGGPGWAVCDVDQLSRETARKKSDS